MEMRLRAPVTRGYFFLLGALRLVNAAIDQKKISSGTLGKANLSLVLKLEIVVLQKISLYPFHGGVFIFYFLYNVEKEVFCY